MADNIRATDHIQQAVETLLGVFYKDFDDTFCDANEVSKSWQETSIPEVILRLIGTLDMNPSECTVECKKTTYLISW